MDGPKNSLEFLYCMPESRGDAGSIRGMLDARGINHVIEHADSFSFSPLLFLLSSLCVREIQTIHAVFSPSILRQMAIFTGKRTQTGIIGAFSYS